MGKATIIIKNKYYYYYDDYETWNQARKVAKSFAKKNKKCKYFILKYEGGFIIPKVRYRLYMTNVMRLF